jgi:excisionase family DNA binding protein
MGSNFAYVTIDKAAEHLSVTRRTIYKYIKRGFLRTKKEGKGSVVLKNDVRTLLDLRSKKDLPYPVNKKTLARMDARIQMLEKQVETMMRILDMRHEPLGLSVSQLNGLYVMAHHHLKNQWSPHEELIWVDTFIRIRFDDFEEMQKMVDDEHPWRPLYQLCKAMLQAPCDPDNKLQLNAGKSNLEKIAQVWTAMRGIDDKKLVKIVKEDDKAVRKVVRKRKPEED